MNRKMRYRPLSLKWTFIGIVLVCFVLPVLVFAVTTVKLITENSERQVIQTATYNFDSAVRGVQINLQNAITVSRAASYDPTVRLAYEQYRSDGNEVALYGEVQGFLSRQYSYDPNILATMFFFTENPFAQESAADKIYLVTNGPSGSFTEMFRIYRSHVHAAMRSLSDEIGTSVRFAEYGGSLYLARNIMNSLYRPYAMIVLQLDTSHVFSNLQGMAWETGTSVALNGMQIFKDGADFSFDAPADTDTHCVRSDNGYTVSKQGRLEDDKILFASRLENMPLTERTPSNVPTLLLALLLTAFLMALFISFFYRSITKPVGVLTGAAGIVQAGELGYQMHTHLHSSEFNLLAVSFNRMSERLKSMFEQNEKEQLALQDARIDALQSQIHPHFLNNTLEIINWEARMAGATRVSEMIEALSTLLSGAMGRSGETMVRLSEELDYVDAYLYIIAARIGKRLRVEKEVDPSLLSETVPRLILQPLVENAVEHGILPRQQGLIVLRVYRHGSALLLEVENDAVLTREREAHIHSLLLGGHKAASDRLGLRNVKERVKLIYGEGSELTITAEHGRTLVRLRLSPPGNA